MGGFLFFTLRFLLALFPILALNFPIWKWAANGAILGAFGYLTISGESFATLRSFLMIAIFFLSILADQQVIALSNVALADHCVFRGDCRFYAGSQCDCGANRNLSFSTGAIL
jgi:competence protein ComEC